MTYELADPLDLFEGDKVATKLRLLPVYVSEARTSRLQDPLYDPNHDKIILEKWSRKDIYTKRFAETPEIIFYRVALQVAKGLCNNDPELDYSSTVEMVFTKFINREIYPNTPYMANAGHSLFAGELLDLLNKTPSCEASHIKEDLERQLKQEPQLFACYVLGMSDSRKSINQTMDTAAEIHAHMGGTGFNFSLLRPANEVIEKSNGVTDGPVSFMSGYSHYLGRVMNQGGKREGANMFNLDYNHPDIMRFIYCKRQDGEVSAANISVTVEHEFFRKARAENPKDRLYPLVNPHYNPELRPHIQQFYTREQLIGSLKTAELNKKAVVSLKLGDGNKIISPWLPDNLDEEYRVIGEVGDDGFIYLDASKVLRHLAFGAWFNGEPGIIHLGHINDGNPTHPRHYLEYLAESFKACDSETTALVEGIRDCNPDVKVEELLLKFIQEKDENGLYFNLPIGVGEMRATNPCGEKPLLPDEACVLGHTNWVSFLERVPGTVSDYKVNERLLAENTKLMYELLDDAIDANYFINMGIERTQKSNRKIGLGFMGLGHALMKLELPYNSQEGRDLVEKIWSIQERITLEASRVKAERLGAFPNFKFSSLRKGTLQRNAILRTLAPTGTTSTIAKVSGGMEPEYALAYTRETVQGTRINVLNPVLEEKITKYPFLFDPEERHGFLDFVVANGSMQGYSLKRHHTESDEAFKSRESHLQKVKRFMVISYDISPEDHLKMEAVVQKHTDDAISKTVNFRHSATVDDIIDGFLLADELGIKGLTFYREGTRKDAPLQVGRKPKEVTATLEEILEERLNRAYPNLRGTSQELRTPFGHLFLNYFWKKEDGTPYNAFITIARAGSDIAAMADAIGRSISDDLTIGFPIQRIIKRYKGIGGESQSGVGHNRVKSLPDGIAQLLERAEEERKKDYNKSAEDNKKTTPLSGNLCHLCSCPLQMSEGCEKCSNMSCSYSKC